MNIFKRLLLGLGKTLLAALGHATLNGLKDEVLDAAKEWVKVAANTEFLDNGARREFVVKVLREKFPFVPESIVRLAVELAVQAVKKEMEKL